jgi:hypothetical protein
MFALQVSNQSGGRRQTRQAASTSSSSPNPADEQQYGTRGPKLRGSSRRNAAATVEKAQRKPSKKCGVRTASLATPNKQRTDGPLDPQSPRDGTSGVGPSPASRAAHKTWACAACGVAADASDEGKLRECSGCNAVRYCGKSCQKMHWSAHKPTCKRLQAARQ